MKYVFMFSGFGSLDSRLRGNDRGGGDYGETVPDAGGGVGGGVGAGFPVPVLGVVDAGGVPVPRFAADPTTVCTLIVEVM